MARRLPMLRLLQGDVGSGKTAVAMLAALTAVGSGYQVAILVPNEVLAAQHEDLMRAVFAALPEPTRPRVLRITGNMPAKCACTRNGRLVPVSPS